MNSDITWTFPECCPGAAFKIAGLRNAPVAKGATLLSKIGRKRFAENSGKLKVDHSDGGLQHCEKASQMLPRTACYVFDLRKAPVMKRATLLREM